LFQIGEKVTTQNNSLKTDTYEYGAALVEALRLKLDKGLIFVGKCE